MVVIAGVIDAKTNFMAHPELVADRILNYASVVGRENVIAGTDRGISTSADRDRVAHPHVETMAMMARVARQVMPACARI
jgi:5-methyltetrahydropteroyltriglutamate--homocysteine methyltransferase